MTSPGAPAPGPLPTPRDAVMRPPTPRGQIVVIRHGQTEWSVAGRHTGRTDIALTAAGEQDAVRLRTWLAGRSFARVLTSPLVRARRTAVLAGLVGDVDDDLAEWDYGGYEGRTGDDIRAGLGCPWVIWDQGVVPGATPGELIEEVGRRVDRVLARVRPDLDGGGDVALVAHGHVLRILTARWLGLPPQGGRHFVLATTGVGLLGYDRDDPALHGWNIGAGPPPGR